MISAPARSLPPVFAVRRLTAALGLAAMSLMASACGENPAEPDDNRTSAGSATGLTPDLAATSTPLTFRTIVAGGWHTCGVTSDNRAFCWGLNRNGQLGDGTAKNRFRPVPVLRGLQFVQVSAGYYTTCGITSDNLAYCWGSGEHGTLGNGESRDRQRPVPVKGGLHFTQVSMGPDHSCALTTTKRAYCWGRNYAGQLGDGTTTERSTPVPVAGGLHFRRLKAGSPTCALATDGKTYCWGGQHHSPTVIPGGFSFVQVTSGCGITADHQAWCWKDYGQPTALAGGLSWTQVVVGQVHACGVTRSDQAYCWGDNFTGGLGDGTETDRENPTPVIGGRLFIGITPGQANHTCALTSAGRAYCWGHNPYGQLGLGTNNGPETCDYELACSTKPRAVVGP